MQTGLTTLIFLTLLTLFQGCGDDDTKKTKTKDKNDTNNSIVIKSSIVVGKTTLSSGMRKSNKAIVCLDKNRNNICEQNEAKTFTDPIGNYSLNAPIEEGDLLLATGGISIFPPYKKNTFVFSKIYSTLETEQNINMLSNLIAKKVENENVDYNASLTSFAKLYDIFERNLLLSFPLDNVNDNFGDEDDFVHFLSGLENFVKNNPTLNTPSYDSVEDVIGDLDEFDEGLSDYSDFLEWFNDTDSNDDANDEREIEFDDKNVTQTELLEDNLIGVWFLKSTSDKLCMFIDTGFTGLSIGDKVTITDTNDKVTNLNLVIEKKGDDIKSIIFKYGFITTEKININNYRTDYSFTGIYTKDKLTVEAQKMSTLNECKRKLGL